MTTEKSFWSKKMTTEKSFLKSKKWREDCGKNYHGIFFLEECGKNYHRKSFGMNKKTLREDCGKNDKKNVL